MILLNVKLKNTNQFYFKNWVEINELVVKDFFSKKTIEITLIKYRNIPVLDDLSTIFVNQHLIHSVIILADYSTNLLKYTLQYELVDLVISTYKLDKQINTKTLHYYESIKLVIIKDKLRISQYDELPDCVEQENFDLFYHISSNRFCFN